MGINDDTPAVQIMSCFSSYLKETPVNPPENITSLFQSISLPAGKEFLQAGNVWDSFSIVCSGLVRLSYLDGEGREFTKGLFPEGRILAPCAPSAIMQPVSFSIECFEDTVLLTAPYTKVREALEASSWGPFLLVAMLEEVLDDKVDREYALLMLDAEARYLRFVEMQPGLAERLPLYLVANYLGMTDVTLSRIRKKLGLT